MYKQLNVDITAEINVFAITVNHRTKLKVNKLNRTLKRCKKIQHEKKKIKKNCIASK